jgi:hypothetical protein
MSVQICEGVWRNRSGQRLVITQFKRADDGQQWTDGDQRYSDNGSFYGCYGGCSEQDLVEHLGPLPDKSQGDQTAEIDRLRAEGADAIERLQAKWQTEFTAAQQLRSKIAGLQAEIERLQTELKGYAADSHRQLRNLQESHNKVTANLQAEQRGEREGFRIAISMILEGLK